MPRFSSDYLISKLILTGLALILLAVSCGSNRKTSDPQLYGRSTAKSEKQTEKVAKAEATESGSPLSYASEQKSGAADSSEVAKAKEPAKEVKPAKSPAADHRSKANLGQKDQTASTKRERLGYDFFNGGIDGEDSASAVDDAVWRLLDLAEEYHAMGVVANREASWEEAQYYFEKSVTIMANLDIETDSIPTPEANQYNTLLDNIIADYRVTLRSLGQLQSDVTPSVLVERFADLERQLDEDSLVVYGQKEQEITYDLPVKINDRVKNSVVYFQTAAKDAFRKYLTRSKRYKQMFLETIDKHGLPHDLIYLSLVESGYNPKAYSWARASGLWQFISSTGRMYGLKRDWWIDERRDPVKSTDAACRFLKDLYKEFGDWELAMAAYNGGPGRVRKTIRKQGTIDFWKMKLRRQTMDYVPLIYAAAIIAKDQARYGFHDIDFEDPIVWDEVKIDRCLDLKVVAKELGCSLETLKDLNPELLRNYTPPNYKNYILKVPRGAEQKFWAAYDGMPSPKETSWVKHEIRRGETVSTIAAKYGVSQYAIINANDLGRRSTIYAGKKLIVPVPLDRDYNGSSKKNRNYTADGSVYAVRAGDTLWDIARAFGTSVDALRRLNYLGRGSRIYVGQKLKIPSAARNLKKLNNSGTSSQPTIIADNSGQQRTHKVKAGDTLWDIARRYGTTTSQLRRLNSLGRSSRIYPGQKLIVNGEGGPEYVVYKVRRGDSLSRIARRYGTTISRILAVNHLTDPDNLRIGQELRIKRN